jgi:hypothetical protein
MATLKCFLDDLGGVAGVGDMADFLQVSERQVRAWADANGAPRVGNSFAFTLKQAQVLADDVAADDDEDEDDDTPDDEDDAEGDDEDDNSDDGCDDDADE